MYVKVYSIYILVQCVVKCVRLSSVHVLKRRVLSYLLCLIQTPNLDHNFAYLFYFW